MYKRPTLDLRTQIGCKRRDGKKYSIQMVTKGKLRWLYLSEKKKIDFKSKTVLEMKKVTPYLTRQGPVQQEHVTITNIYTSNIRKPK